MAETWGLMPKSQVDNELIEEAIARLLLEHSEDETAHLGVGQSLQSHKASEIIDHVVDSIVADKIKNEEVLNEKIKKIARAYTYIVDIGGNGDYTEIQSAINALPTEGGAILIKNGTYTISSGITITKNNVALVGEGSQTIVKLGNGANNIHIITLGDGSNPYEKIYLSHFKIDGNKDNVTGLGHGVYFNNYISMSEVDHIYADKVRGCGVRMVLSTNNIVINNQITDCRTGGINLYNYSTDNSILYNKVDSVELENGIYCSQYSSKNLILGNDSNNNYYAGIKTIASSFNVVIDNTCDSNGSEGIHIASAAGGDYNIVHGNLCNANEDEGIEIAMDHTIVTSNVSTGNNYGIHVLVKSYNVIIGNIVRLNLNHGIEIDGGTYNTIKGNICRDNSQRTNNVYSEIILEVFDTTYSCYNVVEGNICSATAANKAKYGVREESASDNYNLILGNTCQGAVTANISKQGANSIKEHNIE